REEAEAGDDLAGAARSRRLEFARVYLRKVINIEVELAPPSQEDFGKLLGSSSRPPPDSREGGAAGLFRIPFRRLTGGVPLIRLSVALAVASFALVYRYSPEHDGGKAPLPPPALAESPAIPESPPFAPRACWPGHPELEAPERLLAAAV